MGSAASLLLAGTVVVLLGIVLFVNADAAFNGESVSATVLSLVVFSGTGGLLATVDCIDRIQLVSDLLLLGTGPGIASCLVLTSPARAQAAV